MAPATVWLLHPNTLFREGLKRILAGSPFAVTTDMAGLHEMPASVTQTMPDLVLLDLAGDSEAMQLRQLRDQLPTSRLVLLTAELKRERLTTALDASVDGYLLSELSPAALVQSLQLVLLGEKVFPTSLAALFVSGQIDPEGERPGGGRGLSEREGQILRLLLDGASNKMIALRLGITEATVKVHLKTLVRKIGVTNRTQAAIWALNHGFDPSTSSQVMGS